MDEKKIEEIVDKLLDSRFIKVDEALTIGPRGSTLDKIDARQGIQHQPYGEPEEPLNYRDWIKQQPKPRTIGMRKMKKNGGEFIADYNFTLPYSLHFDLPYQWSLSK